MDQSMSLPWPRIREDLTLYQGPADALGSPTWTMHDSVRNQYFQIDWVAFEVITRIYLKDAGAICESINDETTLHITEDSVKAVLAFLRENELTVPESEVDVVWLAKRATARQKSLFETLLHGYLFFRVPLFRPDRMLDWLKSRTRFLFSLRFIQLTALVFILGWWNIFRQWHSFESTLIDTFSIEGLLGYAGALIVVKVLHEFGHALMAKRCGCRVPTMGVAFLVMWPMAYTDVTESWKLDSHRKRLMIAGAGIATEMVVAAWAIFLWGILPEGGSKSVSFFLGTVSIVATFAINASPFMRFDGYFLLCDILGLPNLHARAFSYARWWFREKLFRLGDEVPEVMSPKRQYFFLTFATLTWIYRVIVFTGIAILVYNYFFKALGVALFVVEVWFFLLRPVVHEFKIWHKRRDEIISGFRRKPAFYILIFLSIFIILPLDVTVNTQGVLKPEHSLNVITPLSAQVTQLPPEAGTRVASGELLVGLQSPDLLKKIRKTEARIEALSRQVGGVGFDQRLLTQQPILKEQLKSAQDELVGLNKELMRLRPIAPFEGVITDAEPDLQIGEWLPKAFPVVTLIDDKSWIVDCYVDEADLKRLEPGRLGRFVSEGQALSGVWLEVIRIDRDATRILTEGSLASVSGGEVLVRSKENKLIPERSIYRVRLKVRGDPAQIATGYLRGRVVILAWPKSVFGDFIRGTLVTVIRELGF